MTFSGTVNVLSVRQVKPMVTIVGLVISHCLAGAGCHRAQPYLGNAMVPAPVPNAPAPAYPAPFFSNWFGTPPPRSLGQPALAASPLAADSELSRRLQALDENNRQLQTQLAQAQQSAQLASEERSLLRRQLQDVTNQLQQTQIASASARGQMQEQLQGMTEQMRSAEASHRLRGGARLTANSSLRQQMSGLQSLGFPVIQDGDVIRLRVPADQLFQPNTSTLTPSAAGILDQIAQVITQDFPRQRIGVEGHTDTGPFYGGTHATAQQLAAAQSTAIVEHLQRRNQVSTTQLFSLAHGTNHPVADNQSPSGRSQNRRIEFVIYPDTF